MLGKVAPERYDAVVHEAALPGPPLQASPAGRGKPRFCQVAKRWAHSGCRRAWAATKGQRGMMVKP